MSYYRGAASPYFQGNNPYYVPYWQPYKAPQSVPPGYFDPTPIEGTPDGGYNSYFDPTPIGGSGSYGQYQGGQYFGPGVYLNGSYVQGGDTGSGLFQAGQGVSFASSPASSPFSTPSGGGGFSVPTVSFPSGGGGGFSQSAYAPAASGTPSYVAAAPVGALLTPGGIAEYHQEIIRAGGTPSYAGWRYVPGADTTGYYGGAWQKIAPTAGPTAAVAPPDDYDPGDVDQASADAVQTLTVHEGFTATPVLDNNTGKYEVGYGTEISPADAQQYKNGISTGQAMDLLNNSVSNIETWINSNVAVPLNQNQFDALTDLIYNVGTGSVGNSQLLANLNSGDFDGAAAEFLKGWDTVQGQYSPGLAARRDQEFTLFTTPPPAPAVNDSGPVLSVSPSISIGTYVTPVPFTPFNVSPLSPVGTYTPEVPFNPPYVQPLQPADIPTYNPADPITYDPMSDDPDVVTQVPFTPFHATGINPVVMVGPIELPSPAGYVPPGAYYQGPSKNYYGGGGLAPPQKAKPGPQGHAKPPAQQPARTTGPARSPATPAGRAASPSILPTAPRTTTPRRTPPGTQPYTTTPGTYYYSPAMLPGLMPASLAAPSRDLLLLAGGIAAVAILAKHRG